MIRQLIVALSLLFILNLRVNGQKVIDSVSQESCDCMEKMLATMKLPVEDSLNNCITISVLNHTGALSKAKKLNPGTVEGIREIHARVRKSLKKKCRVFTGKDK